MGDDAKTTKGDDMETDDKKARITSPKRIAEDDLEICFKLKGEEFSMFISQESLKSVGRSGFLVAMESELACTFCCSGKQGFGACMARCLDGGKCCDNGQTNCEEA